MPGPRRIRKSGEPLHDAVLFSVFREAPMQPVNFSELRSAVRELDKRLWMYVGGHMELLTTEGPVSRGDISGISIIPSALGGLLQVEGLWKARYEGSRWIEDEGRLTFSSALIMYSIRLYDDGRALMLSYAMRNAIGLHPSLVPIEHQPE
ncbi:MAG: hypothetical protein KGH72_04490 [Candidatus Micrarchaeota archaeon]|nr:hypothetical protein [Candidatus Micrarchaeota archaeon]